MGKQKIRIILLLLLFYNTYGLASEPYQNVKKWTSRIVIGSAIVAIPTLCFIWRHDIAKSLLTVLPEPSRNSLPPQLPPIQPMILPSSQIPSPDKPVDIKPSLSVVSTQKSPLKTAKNNKRNVQQQPELTPLFLQQMRAGLKKQENAADKKQRKSEQSRIDSNSKYAKIWRQWQEEREDS